jgi:predicted ArsR family transcriptional regulator
MLTTSINALMSKTKKEQVIELLKKDTDGFTIIEIAKALKISRNTVPVVLAELKGEGKIRIRPVGKAKLHYWKK